MIYYVGRFLQMVGLITMPSAIWVGHFGHNERASIIIFVGSAAIFYIGVLLAKRNL